ncbi:MAG: ATP-binding protein [Oscillospiraceae bacterium]
MLLIGPPGSEEVSSSSERRPFLPDMTWESGGFKVYSVLIQPDPRQPLVQRRPFRSPHHAPNLSSAGLAGERLQSRPGEISMAHQGCCFRCAEFKKTPWT